MTAVQIRRLVSRPIHPDALRESERNERIALIALRLLRAAGVVTAEYPDAPRAVQE